MKYKPRLIDANELYAECVLDSCDPACFDNIYIAPTITPTPQWIPVAERLPEDMDSVIVTDADGSVFIGQYNDGDNIWRDDMEIEIDYIVAWMPLPEPYRVKMDGEDGEQNDLR